MTHLAGDLLLTSTLESKNTGCSKLGTLLRSHLDQGPITYVEGMALVMCVSLRDSRALEIAQKALAATHSIRMRSINCRTFSERVFTGGPDCRRQEKDRGQTRNSGEEEISWYWK